MDRLHKEIAFLGYYLHWDYNTLLNMEHAERERWVKEVSAINNELNEDNTSNSLGKPEVSILDM